METATGQQPRALGPYLTVLRDAQGWTKAEVVRLVNERLGRETDRTTYYRLEDGEAWPESDYLIVVLDILGGTVDDVAAIQSDPMQDGAELARQRLTGAPTSNEFDVLHQLHTELVDLSGEIRKRIRRRPNRGATSRPR